MRDPALARFALLQLVRLAGTLIVLIGTLAASGNVPALAFLPPWAPLVLALVGLALFFAGPRWLARGWKTKS